VKRFKSKVLGFSDVRTANSTELFKRANAEWESGRNKGAFTLFLKAAEEGQPSAQHNVGYFFDEGIGTRKSQDRALYWYKKAWRNDRQSGTCINIAKLYESKNNSRLAIAWWMKAIAQNDGDAALDLAKHYLRRNRERNASKAKSLLRQVSSARSTGGARTEAAKLLKKL